MDKAIQDPVVCDAKMAEILEDISETVHQHCQRDLSFYLVLILAVLPLWSVVPLSWAFVIYALWTGSIWSFTWKGQAIFALAMVEVRLAPECPAVQYILHVFSALFQCLPLSLGQIRGGSCCQ